MDPVRGPSHVLEQGGTVVRVRYTASPGKRGSESSVRRAHVGERGGSQAVIANPRVIRNADRKKRGADAS